VPGRGRRAWRAGLVLLVLSVAALAGEGALVLRYGTREGLVRAPALDSPYLYVRAPDRGAANERGILRDERTPAAPPRGGLRVLSYGDSIAGGWGVALEESYGALLERALDARGEAEVLSMARGHSPTAYAFHLRVDAAELDPDAVLVMIELSNDVSDEARVRTAGRDEDGLPAALLGYRYALSWDDQLLAPIAIGLGPLERTRLHYALSRLVGRTIGRLHVPPAFAPGSDTFYYALSHDRFLLDAAALGAGFDRLFEALAGMHRRLGREGRHFAVALLPPRHAFEPGSRYRPGALRLLERAGARARALGLPLVPLRTALARAGGAALYQDFCHPTAAGHRAIAGALGPLLAGWQDLSSRPGRADRSAAPPAAR